MPPASQTPQPDPTDPFAIPSGFPTRLRDRAAQGGELTRCGLFAAGAPDRVTDELEKVDCYDCMSEGPAAAYVVLPDGRLVDRRSSALDDFPYAVVELRETSGATTWRLATWEDGIGDAEFTRDHRFRGHTAQIVPVQPPSSGT